jgi:anti-sigma regulatory factor (Ser/Thr protein kinase)
MHTPAARTCAPGTAERIRSVRSDLRDLLGGCPSADDVILCASELATNAVRHSHSGLRGGAFTVRVTVTPSACVRIDVEDDGGPWAPALGDPARHHGLTIIRALAADLAIDGDDSGRIVSALLNWTPQPE